MLVSKLIQEISELQFLPTDQVKIEIVKDFSDKSSSSNTAISISMPSSRHSTSTRISNNTQEIIDKANRKKEVIKETYSLEKFMSLFEEIIKNSENILTYFFV